VTAPPLQGISHLALSVADLPAALAFWTTVMGFEVTTDEPGLGFVVHREARIGIAVTDHGGAVAGGFDELRPGLDHLAFAVGDAAALEAWRARLAAYDVTHAPIADSGSGLHLNLRAPGGLPIELYVMSADTAAAFGLATAAQAYAVTP
jgi:catechol 2,3-dioxygenase-like lactoylglutathione lyase family enzyme